MLEPPQILILRACTRMGPKGGYVTLPMCVDLVSSNQLCVVIHHQLLCGLHCSLGASSDSFVHLPHASSKLGQLI